MCDILVVGCVLPLSWFFSRGWNNETESSVASVTWPGGSTTNVYRMGYRGKVDLKYVVPEKSPTYHYKEHLPVLGESKYYNCLLTVSS